jgi:hypothetical protein
MAMSSEAVEQLMERASEELAAMHYLPAEAICQTALSSARQAGDWDLYARILLPLQECRRQRRMIAAEGVARIGSNLLSGDLLDAWGGRQAGCLLVTLPHTPAEALRLHEHARQKQWHVEVLYAPQLVDAGSPRTITLHSFAGPSVTATTAAPPETWRERWLDPRTPRVAGKLPGDWFIDAGEALGDAALKQVQAPPGSAERVDQLEQRLATAPDHELLHQHLLAAARALALRH